VGASKDKEDTMPSAVIFQIQSLIILLLMIFGATRVKKNLNQHIKIMSAAIIWDLLLILQIELTRSAVATAMKVTESPMALNIHLFFAVGSVVLYGIMIATGRLVLNGEKSWRRTHKLLGITTLVFRTLTLLTSYFVA
jgi:hypothetical protein